MNRRRPRHHGDDGSAVAEFALVTVVLVPLFLAVLQLAVIWHVKTTLTATASAGARYGATYDHSPADGSARTRQLIEDTLGHALDDHVTAATTTLDGQPVVEVTVTADVPVLAFWGPTVTVRTEGHAVKEVLP